MEDFISVIPGAAIAALIVTLCVYFVFRSRHKTARTKTLAGDFIKEGSQRFTVRKDTFVSTQTTKTRRSSGSGSSGGSLSGSIGGGAMSGGIKLGGRGGGLRVGKR